MNQTLALECRLAYLHFETKRPQCLSVDLEVDSNVDLEVDTNVGF